jgi:hypothetical protein
MDATANRSRAYLRLDDWLTYSCLIMTACILLWLLGNCRKGIEFTDEGYYLVWIANPFSYDWSVTQFGFVYHPIYRLLGGDIAAVRMVNVLITFFVATMFCMTLLTTVAAGRVSLLQRIALSSGLATAALLALSWLTTPNYRTLALQGILVAMTGLLLAVRDGLRTPLVGGALLGVGGWLIFMAKPTSAAAMAASLAIYLVLGRELWRRHIQIAILFAVAVAIGLLLASAFVIDGSVIRFVGRLRTGLDYIQLVGAGYATGELFRIDDFSLTSLQQKLLTGVAGLTIACSVLAASNNSRVQSLGWLGLVGVLALPFTVALVTLGHLPKVLTAERFEELVFLAFPLAAVAFRILTWQQVPSKALYLRLILLLAVLPHVFVFGTNGNYWSSGSDAALFWVLAGLPLLGSWVQVAGRVAPIFPLVMITQATVAFVLQSRSEAPWRQPSLRESKEIVEVGVPGSRLSLPPDFAAYISDAKSGAVRAGLQPGTPMIDLSGQSPTILHALRAASLGYPWISGGYPGSQAVAIRGLRHFPCGDLARAWVLAEPGGPRALTDDVLASFGASAVDYFVASSWQTAEGAGGYKERREQKLLKPIRAVDVATGACDAARALRQ